MTVFMPQASDDEAVSNAVVLSGGADPRITGSSRSTVEVGWGSLSDRESLKLVRTICPSHWCSLLWPIRELQEGIGGLLSL